MLHTRNTQTNAAPGIWIWTDMKSHTGRRIYRHTARQLQRPAAMAGFRAAAVAAGLLFSQSLAVAAVSPALVAARVNTAAKTAVPRSAAADPNATIAPPDSHSHGRTYGEWAAAWWQWALSIPADRSPLTDPDGSLCGEQQNGPVWFAEGSGPGIVARDCSIPSGKAIFMPVYNWIFGAGVFDCAPSNPGVPCDVVLLSQKAAANTVKAEEPGGILEVIIDDQPVQNVKQYRAQSPSAFSLNYPMDSLVGLPAGVYYPQVTDGYWLMVAPLSAGKHTIQTHVLAPNTPDGGTLEFVSITHITVGK